MFGSPPRLVQAELAYPVVLRDRRLRIRSSGVQQAGVLSNLTAPCQRDERLDDLRNGVIYTSDQTHHPYASPQLYGFESAVRHIETDELQQIRLDQLRGEIQTDLAAGRVPS